MVTRIIIQIEWTRQDLQPFQHVLHREKGDSLKKNAEGYLLGKGADMVKYETCTFI